MPLKNPIISLEEFEKIRPNLEKVVCTSGGFDPIHPGHLDVIIQSKRFGDTLVVIVNGDDFLLRKKGRPFMDLLTRCKVLSYVKGIDYIIPYEIDNDHTVIKALEIIKPHTFTKGGDRVDSSSIPEWNICNKMGTQIITGLGPGKKETYSSSKYLKNWEEFKCTN